MRFVDEWPGPDVADTIGHTPGAWDCPCGPWVCTNADSDDPDKQVRNIRHVPFCPTCGVPRPCPIEDALAEISFT